MTSLTEHATHGGEEKSTASPDADYWGSQGMSLRGHSDTLAAERPAEALSGDSSDEATILNQGRSGTCVRCAIASAIEDQVKWKTGVELNPNGMLAGLMQRLNHARGTSPSVFDGYEFMASDESGLWYNIKIAVTDRTELHHEHALKGVPIMLVPGSSKENCLVTRVISHECAGIYDFATDGRHCVYVADFDQSKLEWVGQNSWGKHRHLNPRISIHHPGTQTYDIVVTAITRVERTSGDSPQDLGSWDPAEVDSAYDEAPLVARIKAAKEANDCRGLVDVMREGLPSVLVVGKGIEAVASLCENRDDRAEAHRVMFGMSCGIPLLLKMMREHQRSEEIARVGFLAVLYLSRNKNIKIIFGESGGIPLLVEMLEEHGKRNAEVAKNGVAALYNLTCADNDDNKKRIAEAGGIAMVLKMMEVHGASNAGVAENGCWVLRKLAYNNDDNKKSIGEAGGIAMILSMMKEHGASNAEVAEYGCGALSSLAENADNKKRIGEAGGIAIILRMMEVHGALSAEVAKYGCAALRSLACNDDNKKSIAEAGGIAIIVSMMEVHGASNAGVAEDGCASLRSFAEDIWAVADNKKSIAEAGGIGMILRMMEVHGTSNVEVAEGGCGALRSLSYINADNQKSIAEAGGIDMIVKMMEKHGASKWVWESWCATVHCLMSMLHACSRAVVVVNASSSSSSSSTTTTSDENKFEEKENFDHESMIDQETLQSLLFLVDEENCQNVKNGMLISNLLRVMALASPSTFLRNIMPVLTVKICDILDVVDEADHRSVFALVRAIIDSIQSIADTRSMNGTNDECTAVAYELMSCITDMIEKNCNDYYVHTITSMHLLIQLGRISPLARSYYHEHQQSVFHWWSDWLETNQSKKTHICSENARKKPSWVARADPEPLFPNPNLKNLRKNVKCIQMNREDEVFANTNICEEIHWFEGHPESLVHRRVSVTWEEYNRREKKTFVNFYQGTLMSFNEKTGLHLILYDDGEKKSYNLYTRLGIELLPLESRLPADSNVGKEGGEFFFFSIFLFVFLFLFIFLFLFVFLFLFLFLLLFFFFFFLFLLFFSSFS